jgi:predicted membrane-bound spermidine synthase
VSAGSPRPLPLAFLLGFVTMSAQALLFREHLLAYAGNEIGMGAFLAAWMLWIGVGAILGRGPVGKSAWLARYALLLLPLAAAVELGLFWHLRRTAGVPVGGVFPLADLLLWTTMAALPLSLLAGYLFTWLARTVESFSSGPAAAVLKVYGVEALGSALGGLAFTGACWASLPTPWLIVAVGIVWWGGLAAVHCPKRSRVAWLAAGLTLLLAAAAFEGLPTWLERHRRMALPIPAELAIEATLDTPYQNLSVARIGTAQLLLSNGDIAGLFPYDGAPLDAAILHTLAPPAPRTLVLGLGAPALVCELVRRGNGPVVYVGADRTGLDFVLEQIPELGRCLDHPLLEVVEQEPQYYLEQAAHGPFDLVVYAVPEPRTAQSARFYTLEFMELVAGVLSADGVLSFNATATENVLSGSVLRYIGRLHQTLSHVFPQVHFTAGEEMHFYAGKEGANLTTDSALLEARFTSLRQHYPDVRPEFFATRFESSRIAEVATLLRTTPRVPLVTRNRPGVYLEKILASHSGLAWLARLSQPGAGLFHYLLIGVGAFIAALLLAGGRKRRSSRLVPMSIIVVAGMAGMAGQILVLLGYQGRFGTLFAEFGLLNALFLAGLATGGLVPWTRLSLVRRLAPAAPAVASLGIVGLLELPFGGWPLRGLMMVAPLVLGTSVGASLSVALGRLQKLGDSAPQLAVSLEFLDHTGAVVGALVAGTLLVPVCGLVDTAWLLAALGMIPVVLAGSEAAGWRIGGRRAVPATGWRILLVWGLLVAVLSPLLSFSEEESAGTRNPNQLLAQSANSKLDPRSSWPKCQAIPGWGGPLELLVEASEEGQLQTVQLGRQRETPEYLYGIDDWLRSMEGLPAEGLCYDCPGKSSGVDAFTGATVTGEAVVSIVRCYVSPEGAEATAPASQNGSSAAGPPWRLEHALALLFVLVGGGLYWSGRWHLRTFLLALLATVGGVWLNQQLTIAGLLDVVAGPRPPIENVVLWVLAGGALLWGVLGGAIHCGYLCPAGAAMSLVSRLGLRWGLPPSWDRTLRQLKYVVAAVVVWGMVFIPATDWAAADLLRYAFLGRYDALGLAVVSLALVGTLVWLRPWCRYLCPLGAVLSLCEGGALAGKLAPRRRSTHCHLGVEVGSDWDCIRCNRCVEQPVTKPRFYHPMLASSLAALFVAAMLVLMAMRVAYQVAPAIPAPAHRPLAQPDAPDLLPEKPQSRPDGPRLYRQDNEAYPFQRRPGTRQLEEWLRDGLVSGEEARFFSPVPDIGPP